MRKVLNDNPVAQMAVLGLLAVIVAFLLLTRVAHKSGGSDSSATSATTSGAPVAPAPVDEAQLRELGIQLRRRG